MTYQRKNPEDRKKEILKAAVDLARKTHYLKITREEIASTVGIHPSLIRHYFTTMLDLQNAIMHEAVRIRIPALVLQGLAARDPIADNAPNHLKRKAVATVAV